MRKLIMWNLVSVDGCFEGTKHWDLPWHEQVWGEELEQFSIVQLRAADLLLFGRVTYEGMAAYWQTATGSIAEYMNRLPKLVCSRTLRSAEWNNTRLLGDDAMSQIRELKKEGDGDMYVFGSADLSRGLIDEDLYDEYRIGIAPLIYGRGRQLFDDESGPRGLHLLEARSLSNGCVILRYAARARPADSD